MQGLIKKEDKATLSNILNEMMYEEKMTLQELRFFIVYLSKINPKQPDKTEVTFTLEDYANVLGVELNEKQVMAATRKLLRYVVSVRPKELDENDEYDMGIEHVQVFSKSKMLRRRVDGKWYFTFACHDDIKEHLFHLKRKYTSLEVWNILNMGNFQDARMYMLLKQYATIGERTISLIDLKRMLGVDGNAYPQYSIFARDVLKKCQKALKERTDLCFDFKAVGRPAKAVCFTIMANQAYQSPSFLREQEPAEQKQKVEKPTRELTRKERDRLELIEAAREGMGSDYEFTDVEMEEIVVAMEQSEWWKLSKDALFGTDTYIQVRRHQSIMHYIEAQYVYTKSRVESNNKAGFKAYLVKAVREYYEKYPVAQKIGFDVDEFFDAATLKE